MEKYDVGSRYKYYYKYSKNKTKRIDMDDNLLKYMMSKSIFINNESSILSDFLSYINTSLRFLFNYVDRLKHFKNYLHFNR